MNKNVLRIGGISLALVLLLVIYLLNPSAISDAIALKVKGTTIKGISDISETYTVTIKRIAFLPPPEDSVACTLSAEQLEDFKSLFIDNTFLRTPLWRDEQSGVSCPSSYNISIDSNDGQIISMRYDTEGYLTVKGQFNDDPLKVDSDWSRGLNELFYAALDSGSE